MHWKPQTPYLETDAKELPSIVLIQSLEVLVNSLFIILLWQSNPLIKNFLLLISGYYMIKYFKVFKLGICRALQNWQ